MKSRGVEYFSEEIDERTPSVLFEDKIFKKLPRYDPNKRVKEIKTCACGTKYIIGDSCPWCRNGKISPYATKKLDLEPKIVYNST